MKILLSGAQCVGKTTLVNSLKSIYKDWIYFDEVVRKLASKGIKVSELGNDETQLEVMKAHIENLQIPKTNDIALYDRGALDCFGYSVWLHKRQKIKPETFNQSVGQFKTHIKEYDYIFFIKPEFEIQDDGFRSTSKEFQTEMTEIFEKILADYQIKHTILSGSVIERIQTLQNTIKR
jgi:nicotinamide riboside kinase